MQNRLCSLFLFYLLLPNDFRWTSIKAIIWLCQKLRDNLKVSMSISVGLSLKSQLFFSCVVGRVMSGHSLTYLFSQSFNIN